jgi:branched-chain amino acid transport system substrate-binding protein
MAMKTFQPDVVWHGNTTMSVAATMRDAFALELGADHIMNNWALDENLPRLAGEAAEGAIGATPCAFYGQPFKNMDIVVAAGKKYSPGVPQEKRLIRSIQAWGNALLLWEALIRADKAGDLTGKGIMQKGFESLRNFDIGLGAAPITFTETDHRPGTGCLIQEWKDGKFQEVANVNLKQRWPEKWEKEWLGW